MIWYSGQTSLFLFPFGKGDLEYLPTALIVALRPLSPFQQAQYAKVFPLKPAPFCKLFVGISSTNKPATSLFFSSSLTLALSLPPCSPPCFFFYLNLSGRSGRNCLLSPPVLLGCNGSPDTHFSRGTTQLMSWPDGERYSCTLQSLVVSLLVPLVSTFIFLGLEAYCLI